MQQLIGHRGLHSPLARCRDSKSASARHSPASVVVHSRQQHVAHAHTHRQPIQQDRAAAAQQHSTQQWSQDARQQQQGLLGRIAVAAAAAAMVCAPMAVAPDAAIAADTVKIGSCLLAKCQLQLAKCLGDPKCFQNIVCLNTCNGLSPEDEAACQIRFVPQDHVAFMSWSSAVLQLGAGLLAGREQVTVTFCL